jgi:hypothetical protein
VIFKDRHIYGKDINVSFMLTVVSESYLISNFN